ncbi:uncharacterized protein LOC116340489 [Contarinia nasturtii]|uniref:uncharacterized protein LOC116340489 n=1 Tax=Contarinia nasturtii TaxID=265458 RepID=UPI0012D48C12|nr:uncharacterized protein LOC116340489 [Contarinia nasturtii]
MLISMMNLVYLFVLISAVMCASNSANEELGNAIRICRQQFPKEATRNVSHTDFIKLSKNDKCYLHCILTEQKLIVNDALNADSLQYATNDDVTTKIKTQCGAIRDSDRCELAAKVQKCIEDVSKTTPIE